MPGRTLGGPAAWRGAELAHSEEWIRRFAAAEFVELRDALVHARSTGVSIESLTSSDFPLPTLATELAAVGQELLHGRGFVLLRGLADAGLTDDELAWTFWGIGLHLGIALPQNGAGHLLGLVADLGLDSRDPEARIYQTRERQGFHTDSADLVALLCVNPAKAGGRSALASCVTVHDEMRARCPELLARLFEPFCTDHRGEFPPGSKPYFTAPILNYFTGELSVLYQRSYIESAQRFADVPRLTESQIAALDAFDELLDDAELHLEMDLRPGDIQIIHNHQLLHDRTAFEDWPEPDRRRRLLRLWLSPPVGRSLPPSFASRYGSLEPGRRGGVALRGVAPVVPSW